MGCGWDELRLILRPAGGGAAFYDQCIMDQLTHCEWQEFTLPLDVTWGDVEISFWFDVLDDWINDGSGPFIDDLRVTGETCPAPLNYCTANANTSGLPAQIGSAGSTSLLANDFELHAHDCPPGNPGIFFYGATQIAAPFADGILCLGTGSLSYFRVQPVVFIDAAGSVSRLIDNVLMPYSSGPGQLLPGDTWNFQFWFRDGGAGLLGSNFSDGLEVIFCP